MAAGEQTGRGQEAARRGGETGSSAPHFALNRLLALVYQDFMVIRRSKYRLAEMVYFPLITLAIWGSFSVYMRSFSPAAGLLVFVVYIFWSFAFLAQSTSNLMMMEDSWSRSFTQILASGISEYEYLFARLVTATLVSLLMMAVLLSVAVGVFGLTLILEQAPAIAQLMLVTLLASFGLSVIIGGMILSFGREYGFLAWTSLEVFIFLSAPFFPPEIFPLPLQALSSVMPFTAVFAGLRGLVLEGALPAMVLQQAFLVAAGYLLVSFPFFFLVFRWARKTGRLTRLM